MPELIPGPILLIDEGTRSLADGEIVKLIDVTVFDEATPEKILGQKLSEPEKLGKVKFGKDIDDKVKKGTLRRMETEGLHVQVGAGKKKQILDKYVPTELNHVNGAEKAKEHAKICTGYLDQVVADLNSDQSSQSEFDLALTSAPPPHHTLRAQPEFGSVAFRSLHLLGIFVAVDKDGHYKGLERVDVQIEDS